MIYARTFLVFALPISLLVSPLPTIMYRHFNLSSSATPTAGLHAANLSIPTAAMHSGRYSVFPTPATITTNAVSRTLSASPVPIPSKVPPIADIHHNRCYVHVHQVQMWQGVREDAPSGKITALVTDNNHNRLGDVFSYYGLRRYAKGQHDVEVKTQLSNSLHIAPGEPVDFWIGDDRWKSTDDRCSVGEWERVKFYYWELRRPRRDMDCGFAC